MPHGDDARLWLFGVARNVFLRGLRRRRAGDALVERLAGELHTARGRDESAGHPARPTVEDALASLDERDREILTLTAWEGLSPREIATVLGTSSNLVRVRLHRTRRRLQRELDGRRESAIDVPLLTPGSEC